MVTIRAVRARSEHEFATHSDPAKGTMSFSLKRLFNRQIVDGPELVGPPVPTAARSGRQKATLIILAGVLAIVGAVVSGYYFTMRPVPLRFAVGPQSSDDVRVVQALGAGVLPRS